MGKNKRRSTRRTSFLDRFMLAVRGFFDRSRLPALIPAFISLLILVPLVEILTQGYYQKQLVDERARVIQEFKPIQFGFETGLKTGEVLTESLSAFTITR